MCVCVCVRVCVLRHMCMRACVCTYTCGPCVFVCYVIIIIIIIIYPLTARVVGAPQVISQPVSSICPCSPLPSGSWRTPGQSIPCCRLPTAFSICLVFFPLSQCLARWFWTDLMNGRHVYTTAVCASLRWPGGLRVVRLPAGSWHGLPRFLDSLCMRCVVSCGSIAFPWLVFSVGALKRELSMLSKCV